MATELDKKGETLQNVSVRGKEMDDTLSWVSHYMTHKRAPRFTIRS